MFKFFCAALVATAFAAQSAQAGDCCCSDHSAPATADHQAKAADQTQQAQANTQNRSYSYEPAEVPVAVRQTSETGFYAGSMYNEPRIIGSYGHRPASDKTIGNY